MAPVISKRRKTLPPLTERLVEVQKQIDRLSGKPEELCKGLQHVIDLDGSWPYEKADLMHWAKVLDILDEALGKDDSPDALLIVSMKFTRLLLENCSNRHVYNSYEHLKKKLEHDNCEVVMAVLRVLSVLATPRSTRQVVCEQPFINKLSALSSIFSGSANGPLSLSACCKDASEEVKANGASVRVQFYRTNDEDANKAASVGAAGEGAATVLLYNVHEMPGTDKEVYDSVISNHNVPPESEFMLRSKVRLARTFANKHQRLQWVRVQVMATSVLAQCQAANSAVASGQTPVNEAQLAELIGLLHSGAEGGTPLRAEDAPPLDLQTLALKALTALLSERSRQTAAILSSTAAAHHGILSALMRRAKVLVNDCSSPDLTDRLKFGEALLAFTWMFASSSTGSNALNTAGIMQFILPILQDADARRGRFTTLAVKTLEVLMNYSPEMQQTFRDMDGLNILVARAYAEVYALFPAETSSAMDTDGKPGADAAEAAVEKMQDAKPLQDAMVQDASNDAIFRPFITKREKVDEEFERCKLLGQLMHLMASAGTPIATSGDVRELMQADRKLPDLLKKIFVQSDRFGAAVFEKAAALLTEFVHQEPSCLQHVIKEGVAESVLNAISDNMPISRGTVVFVPTVIGALCLSAQGSTFVESHKPISKFLGSLASENIVPLLVGDTPSQLGGQLEELMRHNPPLLNSCITGCVDIANQIEAIANRIAARPGALASLCAFASGQEEMMQDAGTSADPVPKVVQQWTSGTAMDPNADMPNATVSTDGAAAPSTSAATADASEPVAPTDKPPPAQAYLLSAIEFLGKLLDPLMSVPEHSRSFVRHKGLEAIMKLVNRPEIPRDFASTDAGKYIILVVGKTAFHSPGQVLGEVMSRTQELLNSTHPTHETEVDMEGGQARTLLKETELRSLELHLTLLSGIVNCLRGSSTATEWDNEKGKTLIDSLAKSYCVLRAAAFPTAQPASSQAGRGRNPAASADFHADANANQDRDWIEGHGWSDLAADGILDGLDLPLGVGGVGEAGKADPRADVAKAMETLLIRLSSSVGNPARRRHDDRNTPTQVHEKALAVALTACFKHLLALDVIPEHDTATFSRAVNAALGTMSLCFFGNQAPSLLVGDAHRHSLRNGVNMLLLQDFEQSDGLDGVTHSISRLVKAFLGSKPAAPIEQGTRGSKMHDQTAKTLVRCLAFCKKMLETQLTSIGRNGQPAPLPGFDSALFNAGVKNKIFAAIEPMWKQASPACWPANLASAILDMALLLMKPNVAEPPAESAAPAAPANVLPTFTHDPATVASLVEMGFPEARVHAALDVVQSNSVELAMEWLFNHEDGGGEDEESSLAAAIALSINDPLPEAPAPAAAAPDPASESAPSGGAEAKQPATDEPTVDAKEICAKNAEYMSASALEWGLDVLRAGKRVEFGVVDMLAWIAKTSDQDRTKVVVGLLDAIKQQTDEKSDGLACLVRGLAILVTESVDCCRTACEQDCFSVICKLLYTKCDIAEREEASKKEASEDVARSAEAPRKNVPVNAIPDNQSLLDTQAAMAGLVQTLKANETQWVCSSMLILNKVLMHDEHAKVAESVLIPRAKDAQHIAGADAASVIPSATSNDEKKPKSSQEDKEPVSSQAAQAAEPKTENTVKKPSEEAGVDTGFAGETIKSIAHRLGLDGETLLHSNKNLNLKMNLITSSAAQDKSVEHTELLRFCMRLLSSSPDSQLLHAAMDISARLTRRHDLALIFLQEGGIDKVLTLPESSAFAGQAILTGSLIRHVLEDPVSLQTSMQNEIRSYLTNIFPQLREGGRYSTVRSFLGNCSNMVQRNPEIFARAVGASCRIITSDRGKFIALIDRKEEKGQAASAEGGANDSMLMDQSVDKSLTAPDTPARPQSAGAKSKSQSRKGFEALSHVTGLLLTRLLSDPRTPPKGRHSGTAPSLDATAPAAVPAGADEKMQIDQPLVATASAPAAAAAAAAAASSSPFADDTPAVLSNLPAVSPVNLLRYLADLVKFFPGCAHLLIKYTVDGSESASKGEASKKVGATEKESFVHFLLRELVPNRGTDSASVSQHVEMSRRATSLVLALLSRSNDVRKRVMTEIVTVLNAPPKGRVTMHLQMLQSLATVLFSFLTAKVTPANPNEVAPETVRQFFDAKVPSALCAAIASIDLHHPNASKVGSALLRPLDILCANSSPSDLKPSHKEGHAAGARAASASAAAATPGTHSEGAGGNGGNGAAGAGAGDDELNAPDVSLVAPRSALDDSGTPVRDSMFMALSMQEDEEDVRGHQDEEMQEGSAHEDMRGSDEGEGSDEDGEDEDGEESGAEVETEGSQQDDDHDSQLQDEGWEEVAEDGDQDDESLLAAGMERDLAAAGFMAPDVGDVDRERDLIHGLQHHHHSHLLSRQDLDSMFEQLMESDGINMPEGQMNIMDRIEMIAGDEMRENPQSHHVLSLLVPGGAGGDNARILQNLLPFSGLAQHMQVIRLPSGRGGRNGAAGGEQRHSPNALHEVPATMHPLLARGGEDARGRPAGAVADALSGFDRISRHMRQEMEASMEASMIFGMPGGVGQGWPGGRFIVGEEPGMAAQIDTRGSASRWSDDGGPSSSSMRTVAQQMEDRLVSMLQAAAPSASAAAAAPSGGEQAHAPAAGAAAAGSTSAMEVEPSTQPPDAASIEAAAAEALALATAAAAQAQAEVVAAAEVAAAAEAAVVAAAASAAAAEAAAAAAAAAAVEAATVAAAAAAAATAAQAATTASGAGEDAMDEDEDELEAALRMSMQADSDSVTAVLAATPLQEASAAAAAGASSAPAAGGAPPADAGIDPAFLAELPEDLRAEVMAQQARQNAVASLAASSSNAIDPEFLAALPPDIQADVIRQHQREEAASTAAQQATEAGASAVNRSEEMDNASFIASLAPDLREEVLMTSNEAFLATLPPHLVAEANLLRERHMTQDMANQRHQRHQQGYNHTMAHLSRRGDHGMPAPMGQDRGRARGGASTNVVKKQVIEEGSVPHILQLLFVSQPVVKTLMNKMLLHITAHPSSLDATVRFLLSSVLQACGGGESPAEIYGCSCSGNLSDGSMAVLLAKRALEALCHVAIHQPNVCERLLQEGFLSETVVQRFLTHQAENDKGKGKQKMEAVALCTPFSLLISLLASAMFSKSTALQEQVLQVLNCALQPLANKEAKIEEIPAAAPAEGAAGASDSTKSAAAGAVDAAADAAKSSSDATKSSEPRYPRVAIQDLTCLTSTLAASGNSTKIMQRSTSLLKTLSSDPVNLITCTTHLVAEVKAEAELSRQGLEELVAELVAADGKDLSSVASVSIQRKHDVRLLRMVKTLRALWPVKDENTGAKDKEDTSQPLAEVVRLEALWHLLGRCLSELEKESDKPKEKESHKPHPPPTSEAAPVGGASSSAAVVPVAGGEGASAIVASGSVAAAAAAAAAAAVTAPQQMSMSPALHRMQALVEAFLVVKAPDHVKEAPAAPMTVPGAAAHRESMEVDKTSGEGAAGPASPSTLSRSTSSDVRSSGAKEFAAFAEEHRQTLNLFIRQDKSLLHSMAYSPLVRFPKLLDFDNKKHYLRSELKKRNAQQRHPSIRLNVRREFVFEDSFHQILPRKPEELKGRLTIVFQGEEGVDAGGLTREWYLTLSKQMLNPDKALFIHSSNGLTYQPNSASTIQPDYLKYFKFAGQLVGKALWDEQLLDAHFTQSMYKHMLNQPIEYTDVESIDPEYYRNLGWMLKNDITDILEETFSIVREQFGVMLTIDLKPNGRNLEVTEENKHEYVQLVAEQQMTRGIKEQIDAFKEGFHQLMPPDLISIFTCNELELLMCGLPTIDIEDLRANTEYTGYTRDSPQISWFWTIVQGMVQEDLARLIQFVTGTSQVPMEGFKSLRGMNGPQKFNIHRCGDKGRLPSSHTCFNQLDLPEYTTEEQLRKNLLSAVREGFEGFGFS